MGDYTAKTTPLSYSTSTARPQSPGSTAADLGALIDLLRAKGVQAFEGHGIKVVLGPLPSAAAAERPAPEPRSLDDRLFGALNIRESARNRG